MSTYYAHLLECALFALGDYRSILIAERCFPSDSYVIFEGPPSDLLPEQLQIVLYEFLSDMFTTVYAGITYYYLSYPPAPCCTRPFIIDAKLIRSCSIDQVHQLSYDPGKGYALIKITYTLSV